MWFWIIFAVVLGLVLLRALGWYLRRREDPRLTNLSAARQDNADHRARDAGLPPSAAKADPEPADPSEWVTPAFGRCRRGPRAWRDVASPRRAGRPGAEKGPARRLHA